MPAEITVVVVPFVEGLEQSTVGIIAVDDGEPAEEVEEAGDVEVAEDMEVAETIKEPEGEEDALA